MFSNINMHDFLLLNNANVVDIRSREKYNSSHIDGAINVPYEKIISNPEQFLEKNIKYYIYCQKGTTSFKICGILSKKGYNVINVNGGYESYLLHKR